MRCLFWNRNFLPRRARVWCMILPFVESFEMVGMVERDGKRSWMWYGVGWDFTICFLRGVDFPFFLVFFLWVGEEISLLFNCSLYYYFHNSVHIRNFSGSKYFKSFSISLFTFINNLIGTEAQRGVHICPTTIKWVLGPISDINWTLTLKFMFSLIEGLILQRLPQNNFAFSWYFFLG